MGSNWEEHYLSEIIELVIDNRGRNPSSYSASGIPVIDNYLITSEGEPELSEVKRYISKNIYDSFIRKYNQAGDVLLTLVGNGYGKVAISPKEKCIIIQNTMGLRTKDGFDNNFLYYLLKGNRVSLTNLNRGAAQPSIKVGDVLNLCFSFPNHNQQKSIGNILNQLDKKIQLNRQTNQTLERMAQILFKSWFVDFDPVFDNALLKAGIATQSQGNEEQAPHSNKNEGNLLAGFPEALRPKAKQRLNALRSCITTQERGNEGQAQGISTQKLGNEAFPSEFEFNEQLGWIPKGWEVEAVSKAIQVNPRTTLSKGSVAKFADMKSIPTSGYMVDEVIEKAFSGGAKFKQNDILLARITPCLQNGKTALVDFLTDDEVGFGSTEFIVLRECKKTNYPFIACLARDEIFRAHCMQSMVGSSGRQRVQNACFKDYYLALPKKSNVLDKFAELTSANFTKMTNNKLESQSLTKLRDTLLPKLISGELQLPDLEQSPRSHAPRGNADG